MSVGRSSRWRCTAGQIHVNLYVFNIRMAYIYICKSMAKKKVDVGILGHLGRN